MKKNLVILLIVTLPFVTNAQGEFEDRWNAAYELADAKKYQEAIDAFAPLLMEQPTNVNSHVQVSWCYLLLKNNDAAIDHSYTAYQIDPFSSGAHAMNAYLMFTIGQEAAGKVYLANSLWLVASDDDFTYYDSNIAEMKEAGIDVSSLEAEFNSAKNNIASRDRNWPVILDNFLKGVDEINNSDLVEAKVNFKKALAGFDNVPEAQKLLAFPAAYLVGSNFYQAGDSSNYMPLITRSYNHMKENNRTSYVPLIHMATMLGEHYYVTGKFEKSFELLNGGLGQLTQVNKFKYLAYYGAMFLTQYSSSANAVGNMTEARDAAKLLTETVMTGYDEWYQTNGWVLLAQAWSQDASKATEYYQKAYEMAVANGFEDLKNSIAENLN